MNMLSTIHKGEMQETGKFSRRTGERIFKPDAVIDYNINMRFVDKSDMMIGEIDCLRKNNRWYRKACLHIFDMCMLNALLLCKVQVGGITQPSLRQFSKAVVLQVLAKFGKVTPALPRRHSDVGLPDRLQAREWVTCHQLVHLPRTAAGKPGVGRCRVCSNTTRRPRARKMSVYQCQECQVALCVTPCYAEFHSLVKY